MGEPQKQKRPNRTLPPHPFQPLTMTWREVSETVFRVTEQWLRSHIAEFPDFPQPDRRLDVFATKAVEQWVERRFGLVTANSTAEDERAILMSRITSEQGQRPISRRTPA